MYSYSELVVFLVLEDIVSLVRFFTYTALPGMRIVPLLMSLWLRALINDDSVMIIILM